MPEHDPAPSLGIVLRRLSLVCCLAGAAWLGLRRHRAGVTEYLDKKYDREAEYCRRHPAPGARDVTVRFYAFPARP